METSILAQLATIKQLMIEIRKFLLEMERLNVQNQQLLLDNQRAMSEIKELICLQNLLKKDFFTLGEAATYMQVSVSHMYKLHCNGEIPSYCPTGKKLYFKRAELDEFLVRNRQVSAVEIETMARDYINKKNNKS